MFLILIGGGVGSGGHEKEGQRPKLVFSFFFAWGWLEGVLSCLCQSARDEGVGGQMIVVGTVRPSKRVSGKKGE